MDVQLLTKACRLYWALKDLPRDDLSTNQQKFFDLMDSLADDGACTQLPCSCSTNLEIYLSQHPAYLYKEVKFQFRRAQHT